MVIYGVLITDAGIYKCFNPPARCAVLFGLHSGIWWDALMLVAGIAYTVAFRPVQNSKAERNSA